MVKNQDSGQLSERRAEMSDRLQSATEIAIRLGLVVLLVLLCLQILTPFLGVIIWALIIAIAADSPFERLCSMLGGKRGLASAIFVVAGLLIIIVPAVLLTETLVGGAQDFAEQLRSGDLKVPPPPDKVAEWPGIGERVHSTWLLASENLQEATTRLKPQLVAFSRGLLSAAGSAGVAMLQLAVSLIIAGIMLKKSEGRQTALRAFFRRIAPEQGDHLAELSAATVQSVVQGILGVAIIQGVLAGVGFLIAGLPAAGLWALLVMIAAIVQIPVTLVIIPPVLLGFSVLGTPAAIALAVWSFVISLLDNVLKPILFGRGVQVPMLVIFLGAIGGMLAMGIIGLFLGAVILAVSYEILIAWVGGDKTAPEPANS